MLFGGGLFGGKLFIGDLYGGEPETPTPPDTPYYATTGEYAFWPRRYWGPDRPTRAEAYQAMIQQDEEDVLMTVLTLFIEDHDQWDH